LRKETLHCVTVLEQHFTEAMDVLGSFQVDGGMGSNEKFQQLLKNS